MASMWQSSINKDSLETGRGLAYPADGVSCRKAEHSAPSNSGRGAGGNPLGTNRMRPGDDATLSGPSL